MGILSGLFFSKKTHPVVQESNNRFADFDQSHLLADYEYVVFDTELTGFNQRKDEVVSIGAVRIKGLKLAVKDSFYSLVKPKKAIPKNSTLIHGITPSAIESSPYLEDVLEDFVRFTNGALLVGHYVELDIGFINRAIKKYLGGTLQNPCIDTMRMAQAYKEEQYGMNYSQHSNFVSFTLSDLTREFALPEFTAHDAYQDALQTAYLFLFLTKKMRKKGFLTLRDLFMTGRNRRWQF